MRPPRSVLSPVLTGVLLLALTCPAFAKPMVVVLAFGKPGEAGERIRDAMVQRLQSRYEVVHGQMLLDVCDQLGITMSRGSNLATAASHLGAVAVVAGSIKAEHLVLAVYSGKTGQPLATGTVPCPGGLSKANLAKAVALVTKGLQKAPKRVSRPDAASPEPAPEPRPRTPAAGSGGGNQGSGGSLTFDPNDPGGGGTPAAGGDGEENPLARPTTAAPVLPQLTPEQIKARQAATVPPPRLAGTVGLGSWIRSFSMNQANEGQPQYSGAAFTLRLDVRAYPVAFFVDSWPSGFYLGLRYQQAIGLTSSSNSTNGQPAASLSSSMRELLFDAGYNWRIFSSKELSPYLSLGLGGGLMDFSIDWPDGANVTMPASSYRFFMIGTKFCYPFVSFLGAHVGLDYRVISGVGDIEDPAKWYGPSSTGGINLSLGLDGSYKGFIGTLEYSYTRYFYAFVNDGRDPSTQKVAGGALDQYHTFMVSAGYQL